MPADSRDNKTLSKIKGNKKYLLESNGLRSYKDFQKKFPDIQFSNEGEFYEYLLSEHNEVVRVLREKAKEVAKEAYNAKRRQQRADKKAQKEAAATPEVIYKFLVRCLITTVTHPIDQWISKIQFLKFIKSKKNVAKLSADDVVEEKIADSDGENWKSGDLIVHVIKPSADSDEEINLFRQKQEVGKPAVAFEMTTLGVKCYVIRNLEYQKEVYTGKKPYNLNQFVTRDVVEDKFDINPFVDGDRQSVPTYLNLKQFNEKAVFELFTDSPGHLKIREGISIMKVNDQFHQIGPMLPLSKIRMKAAFILKSGWLRYAESISETAFEETANTCVYHQLAHFLLHPAAGNPTQFINKRRVSPESIFEFLKIRHPLLLMDDGVTTEMVAEIGQETKRNVYAYNFEEQCFFKQVGNNTANNYSPVIFYLGNGHMYLINSKDAVKSVAERNKGSTTSVAAVNNSIREAEKMEALMDKDDGEIRHLNKFDGVMCDDVPANELPGGVYIIGRYSMSNDVVKFISTYKDIPRVRCTNSVVTGLSYHNTSGEVVTISCDTNYGSGIEYGMLREAAEENGIRYVNQGMGAVVRKILNNSKKKHRRQFLDELGREGLISAFGNRCAICKMTSEAFEIDHIRPLADGGTNDLDNLQPLCSDCHQLKTEEERTMGKYIERDEDEIDPEASVFNKTVFENVVFSDEFRTWQFVEHINTDPVNEEAEIVKKIDANKCRRNILLNSKYEFPKFGVMDRPERFIPGDAIMVGSYYVRTANTFPFRGSGWYPHCLVLLGLDRGLIAQDDIIMKLSASESLPADHFRKNVNILLESFENYTPLQKLCVNAYVGLMGKRLVTKTHSKYSLDKYEASHWLAKENSFILNHSIGENDELTLYQCVSNQNKEAEGTMYPIYCQILHMEAMELYLIADDIQKAGGIVMDLNTDAVRFRIAKEDEHKIDLASYFWDGAARQVPKFKWENPKALIAETKPRMMRPYDCPLWKFETVWHVQNDFFINGAECTPLEKVSEILDSRQSIHVDGRGGTGKSYFLRMLIDECKRRELKFEALSPTNKGARVIGGETIHSVLYALRSNKKAFLARYKGMDIMFVDEVSMMQTESYAFLNFLRRLFPKLQFIIAGDFEQLPPVKDSWSGDYKNSLALHDLCGGHRLQLTKNRRSDSLLFDLCRDVQSVDVTQFQATEMTYLNIAYKHTTRIRVNSECMARYLAEEVDGECERVFIKANPFNPKTQDVTLCVGMPVVAHKTCNNKTLKKSGSGFLNSERFEVQSVTGGVILLVDKDREISVKVADFHKYFYVGFCITVHTSQGETFNERYTIHDWGASVFCRRAKYVALSRATSINNIQINP